VHKSATILQQLAALCSFCERTTWKALLNWSSLCGWLQSTVKSLSSEYLKQGEAEIMIPLWLKVLEDAGSDYLHSRTGDNIRNRQEYMQGKGGRTLKRIVRDFAESHRNAPTSLSFMKCGWNWIHQPDGGGRDLCWSSGLTSICKYLSRERGHLFQWPGWDLGVLSSFV